MLIETVDSTIITSSLGYSAIPALNADRGLLLIPDLRQQSQHSPNGGGKVNSQTFYNSVGHPVRSPGDFVERGGPGRDFRHRHPDQQHYGRPPSYERNQQRGGGRPYHGPPPGSPYDMHQYPSSPNHPHDQQGPPFRGPPPNNRHGGPGHSPRGPPPFNGGRYSSQHNRDHHDHGQGRYHDERGQGRYHGGAEDRGHGRFPPYQQQQQQGGFRDVDERGRGRFPPPYQHGGGYREESERGPGRFPDQQGSSPRSVDERRQRGDPPGASSSSSASQGGGAPREEGQRAAPEKTRNKGGPLNPHDPRLDDTTTAAATNSTTTASSTNKTTTPHLEKQKEHNILPLHSVSVPPPGVAPRRQQHLSPKQASCQQPLQKDSPSLGSEAQWPKVGAHRPGASKVAPQPVAQEEYEDPAILLSKRMEPPLPVEAQLRGRHGSGHALVQALAQNLDNHSSNNSNNNNTKNTNLHSARLLPEQAQKPYNKWSNQSEKVDEWPSLPVKSDPIVHGQGSGGLIGQRQWGQSVIGPPPTQQHHRVLPTDQIDQSQWSQPPPSLPQHLANTAPPPFVAMVQMPPADPSLQLSNSLLSSEESQRKFSSQQVQQCWQQEQQYGLQQQQQQQQQQSFQVVAAASMPAAAAAHLQHTTPSPERSSLPPSYSMYSPLQHSSPPQEQVQTHYVIASPPTSPQYSHSHQYRLSTGHHHQQQQQQQLPPATAQQQQQQQQQQEALYQVAVSSTPGQDQWFYQTFPRGFDTSATTQQPLYQALQHSPSPEHGNPSNGGGAAIWADRQQQQQQSVQWSDGTWSPHPASYGSSAWTTTPTEQVHTLALQFILTTTS